MKTTKFILLFIVTFLFNYSSVKAFTEYNIQINTDKTIIIKNAVTNASISLNDALEQGVISDFGTHDGIPAIVLSEGVHYNYFRLQYNTYITSFDKKTYVNIISSTKKIIIEHLNMESYDTSDPTTRFSDTYSGRLYNRIQGKTGLEIKNSIIKFNKKLNNESYIVSENNALLIDDSTIDARMLYSYAKGVTVNNSTLNLFGISTEKGVELNNVILNSFINRVGDDYLHAFIQVVDGDLTIRNSNLLMNGEFNASNNVLLEDTTVNTFDSDTITGFVSESKTLTLNNSTLNTKSRIIVNDVELTDSTLNIDTFASSGLLAEAGTDVSYTSALIVYNNFESTNSSFKVKQDGYVPALIIGGEFITDIDALGFVDSNNNILDLKRINLEDYGFLANPDNYIVFPNEQKIPSTFREAYTLLLNNEPTYSLEPKSIDSITFKVINGTWKDGTTEDIIKRVVRGTTIDNSFIETKPLDDNTELVITKTGDNEYTYEYKEKIKVEVENPKTGVSNLFILLIVTFMGLVYLLSNRNKFSIFKRL